jgi:hypothetical protein
MENNSIVHVESHKLDKLMQEFESNMDKRQRVFEEESRNREAFLLREELGEELKAFLLSEELKEISKRHRLHEFLKDK